MRRRDFIALIGAATTWPLTARAQRPAMPIIGFLDPTSLEKYKPFVLAFHDGLREVGFLESTMWSSNTAGQKDITIDCLD